MAELGSMTLLLALALAVYAAVGSVLGTVRSVPQLVESSRYATYTIPVVLGSATASLVVAFVTRDFSLGYVAAQFQPLRSGYSACSRARCGNLA